MHARVEEPDRPDRRQERQDERPPGRPGRQVIDMAVDVGARVEGLAARDATDGEGDDGGDDDGGVDVDAEGLDLGHDGAGEDAGQRVDDDEPGVDAVDGAVGGRVFAVAGDGDAGQEHEREGIWDAVSVRAMGHGCDDDRETYNPPNTCRRSTPACCCIRPGNSARSCIGRRRSSASTSRGRPRWACRMPYRPAQSISNAIVRCPGVLTMARPTKKMRILAVNQP